MEPQTVHIPVLVEPLVSGLDLEQSDTVIDATLGSGGHACAVLERLGAGGRLLGLDRDPEMVRTASGRFEDEPRLDVVHASYADLRSILGERGIDRVEAIYFDLGLSSYHLEKSGRGFSFQGEGEPLDCRFNAGGSRPASELINEATPDQLEGVLREYGEVRHLRSVTRALIRARPLETSGEVREAVEGAVPYGERKGELARVFQALRIAVNDELDHLRSGLEQALDVLAPGGRMAVISFHSLEDRIVKHFYREQARECVCPPDFPVCACDAEKRCRVLPQSPIQPSTEEVEANPRARSALLRIAEKCPINGTNQE